MRRFFLFTICTFLLGWFLEVIFMNVPFLSGTTPQILMILVIAVGANGFRMTAQSLGFFWGLSLDVFSVGLFGAHTLLFSLLGFLVGGVHRQFDCEKSIAQVYLTIFSTVFLNVGFFMLEHVFSSPTFSGRNLVSNYWLQMIFNILIAPVLFMIVHWWVAVWGLSKEERSLYA